MGWDVCPVWVLPTVPFLQDPASPGRNREWWHQLELLALPPPAPGAALQGSLHSSGCTAPISVFTNLRGGF